MTQEDSWQQLAREPALRTPALARILERAPKLAVTVDLDDARLRLGFGKATLDLVPTFTMLSSPGRRSGGASLVPPTAKHADAILAALVRAVGAEVPARPHAPGFRPPAAVTLEGFHAATEGGSLVWIAVDFATDDGSPGLRLHLLLPPGKARGSLHVELPRGAARRDKLLAALARSLRDGWPPRRLPETDLRCASATPWLTTAPLVLPYEVDLTSARWGGSTLFAARSEDESTLLVRIDGPADCAVVARIDSPDVAFYPSPSGAHVLLEIRRGVPLPSGWRNLTDGHAVRELLDVATGQRTRLVEKHESFAFGDTSGAAAWSADGRRIAMSGSAPFAGGERCAVLVYDLPSGAFVDATPLDGSFLFSHWDGPAIWLRDGALVDSLAFRWEPGRAGPRADALLGRPSPAGRFAFVPAEGRTRVIDRLAGAYAPSIPPELDGRFWAGDAWVSSEDEPRVFDLATGLYRYLAPPSQVLSPNFAERAPLAIFNDGTGWQWGSAASAAGAGVAPAFEHATPLPARQAFGERRARRIEEASILAEDDPTGEARRVVAAFEARLRAEAALSAGNARVAGGGEHAVEAALAHYEAAVRDAPELYEAVRHCAVALGRLGHHPERLRVAAFLCERFPISSGAWLTRSIALHKAGAGAAALDAIERALALDADGAGLPRQSARTTDLLHQRACVHVARGAHDDAVADVEKLLAADPGARDRLLADDDLAPLRAHPLLGGEPARKRRKGPVRGLVARPTAHAGRISDNTGAHR